MALPELSPLSLSSSSAGALAGGVSKESRSPVSPASPSCPTDFLTHLLAAVLSSIDCPLPKDFSAALLRPEDPGATSEGEKVNCSLAQGVPAHPLYKHLARALRDWITTGAFPRKMEPMPGIVEDGTTKAKVAQWTERVVELGSYLLELGEGVEFQLHVQEPYFSQLRDGLKTVEGRCASGAYNKIQAGHMLLFNQSVLLKVEAVKRYSTFHEMLDTEGLSSVLPGVASITEGVQVYRAFYSKAREKAGVFGIHVRHPSDLRQPYQVLNDLLSEINIEGVRTLLGMRSTMGSIPDALPLLSQLFCQHSLPSSTKLKLTVGARALAKHVHRSSGGWWGVFSGTESVKNEIAFRKLCGMMEQAVWLNVHAVPIPVFEFRVTDGYGARWLADGSQFRGFLEPPMEEGYLHKWRH